MTERFSSPSSISDSAAQVLRATAITLSAATFLSYQIASAYSAPNAEQTTETTLSQKDAQLRDIEGELLKQLGMEGTSPAAPSENRSLSLPDVKALMTDPTPSATKTPGAPAKVMVSTNEPSSELGTDEPALRTPQSSVLVAPTKRQPPRTSTRYNGSNLAEIKERLAISESQVTVLQEQLEEAKEQLARSEARVEELSRFVDQQSSATIDSPNTLRTGATPGLSNDAKTIAISMETSSLPTARVARGGASLRTTPGRGGSSLYPLALNSTVRIELRNGSWYRVISSNGTRGWVSGQHLIFYEGSTPGSTVHVRAFDADEEGMGIGY